MILRFDDGLKCCCDKKFPICQQCDEKRRRRYSGNRDLNQMQREEKPGNNQNELEAVRVEKMLAISERLTGLEKLMA